MIEKLRFTFRVALQAYYGFLKDDGWAIASHIALSALMALFPFVIVVTSLAASFLGSKELADEVARILLETWPHEVADPLATEIHNVLTTTRGDILTLGAAFSVYFASGGIESLRIGLNRAYGMTETRNWLLLRLESIAYVLIAALALLALAFLIVLGPLIFTTAAKFASWLAPLEDEFVGNAYEADKPHVPTNLREAQDLFARSVAASSDVRKSRTANAASLSFARALIKTPSAPRNGVAGEPVSLISGSTATFHGVDALMSFRNHGPLITVAALPSLNSVATIGPSA